MSELPPLRELPLFASVDEATLSRLALDAKIENFEDGGVIFRQGDPITAIVVILRGFVRVLRIAASGDETLISILSQGESVNIAPPGADEVYNICAEAVGSASVLKLPAGRFARLMRESPSLAEATLRDAREKVAALVREIESLKSHNADQRLSRFILALCPVGEESVRFRLPYDKRLIAARLGVTQETLSRAFAKLREIGVRTEARDVFVENVGRLHAQCDNLGRLSRAPSQRRASGDEKVDALV